MQIDIAIQFVGYCNFIMFYDYIHAAIYLTRQCAIGRVQHMHIVDSHDRHTILCVNTIDIRYYDGDFAFASIIIIGASLNTQCEGLAM